MILIPGRDSVMQRFSLFIILLRRNLQLMRYPKTGSSVDLQMYNSADILLDYENALCSSQCHSENSNNSSSLEISAPSIIVVT